MDTGVARILSGGALFLKKVDDLFSRRPRSRDGLKLSINKPPNLRRTAKKCPKNCLLLCLWDALGMLRGALTNFPCKLRLKIFFTALRVEVYPLYPLATPVPMDISALNCLVQNTISSMLELHTPVSSNVQTHND